MRFCIISHLIAHSRLKREFSSICKLGVQFAFQAQQDMPFRAPVVGKVAGAVFNQADTDIVELLRVPAGGACLSFVFGRLYLLPGGDAERDVFHFHSECLQQI